MVLGECDVVTGGSYNHFSISQNKYKDHIHNSNVDRQLPAMCLSCIVSESSTQVNGIGVVIHILLKKQGHIEFRNLV